jgi:hypothetical protein
LDLRVVYDQLCESYRGIDDFRAKLLARLHRGSPEYRHHAQVGLFPNSVLREC